jgi:hypothetical protein
LPIPDLQTLGGVLSNPGYIEQIDHGSRYINKLGDAPLSAIFLKAQFGNRIEHTIKQENNI